MSMQSAAPERRCYRALVNLAAGMTDQPLNHEEVQEAADMAAPRFKKLVTESVKKFV
jgi:purine-nucleoside phosphorylase